ncbi:Hypothetical predicted protein [Paramuricea clavata]|uniref:Uncharacterized protein n=1 Tax=Paramuricea clavata TaxID=317549 RepID=A0A6S7J5F3_PARCT|nr:Hypothetical predicted protein [Paramuricea clavata]
MSLSNPTTKIGRQHEKTWSCLQRRLPTMSFDYEKIMPENINNFIKHKATSVNTSIDYLSPTILATISYLLTRAKATISSVNYVQPTNLYTIFVGYPGTGKSSAIEYGCLKPMENVLQDDTKGCLLDRTTSSGLVKHLAKNGAAFMVYPEVSDVLNKLLKSNEETCSGDTMLLCKRFSRERMSFHYATEDTREIDAKNPFSILGLLCPKSHEIEESIANLTTKPIDDLQEVYKMIVEFHSNNGVKYNLDEEAETAMKNDQDCFHGRHQRCNPRR